MPTWDQLQEEVSKLDQMGTQTVEQAMHVGDILIELKAVTPYREFQARVLEIGIEQTSSSRYMRLAQHRDMLLPQNPSSIRKALALLPKKPRRQKEVTPEEEEEVRELKSELSMTAKDKFDRALSAAIKLETRKLKAQANDAVTTAMSQYNEEIEAERDRLRKLMREHESKRKHYENLINKRMNGHDWKHGIKLLRQCVHPDKFNGDPKIAAKAMETIKQIAQFLGV